MPINDKTRSFALAALLALAAASGTNAASPVDFTNPAFAQVGGPTSVPVGHAEFCQIHGDDCSVFGTEDGVTELTEERWAQLVDINNAMNAAIVPITDQDYYNVAEFWTYPSGYGDCEDIALAKRRELVDAGWDPSTLLMAVVRESNGAGHAVLMARTDRGDLVLDNKDGAVKLWADTPYQFLKRQSQAHAAQWVDILDDRIVMVATN